MSTSRINNFKELEKETIKDFDFAKLPPNFDDIIKQLGGGKSDDKNPFENKDGA